LQAFEGLQHSIINWGNLLIATGGALKPIKWSYSLISFRWKKIIIKVVRKYWPHHLYFNFPVRLDLVFLEQFIKLQITNLLSIKTNESIIEHNYPFVKYHTNERISV
jgi:hypothetical protein